MTWTILTFPGKHYLHKNIIRCRRHPCHPRHPH